MPELPEVESVRRGLEEHLVGRRFTSVEVYHPRAVRGNSVDLSEVLPGRKVTGTGRRGKFMWLTLDNSYALIIHLRMSGQMRIDTPGSLHSPHLRIRALMDDIEVCFIDQRTFGSWQYGALDSNGVPELISHIAVDPFDEAFDIVEVARKIRSKSSAIKTVLLEQSVVSGIGSIYADEAMWEARIKPTRRARSLRQKDAVAVLEASRRVMAAAISQGGTSFDALYVNVNGSSGYFSRSLNAYGRVDKPCLRCGTLMVKTVINGRSSCYCPHCQVL